MSEKSRKKTVKKHRNQGIDPNDIGSVWLREHAEFLRKKRAKKKFKRGEKQ